MSRPWKRIEQAWIDKTGEPPSLSDYLALRGAILTAFRRANVAEKRRLAGLSTLHAEQRKYALKAAKLASQLVKHLKKNETLDFLAHRLFPDKVERLALRALRNRDLNKAAVSLGNTTFIELLVVFEQRAQASAQAQPIVQRARARSEAEKDVRPLTFIRQLHDIFFEHQFGGSMHSAIAAITNVALELPDYLAVRQTTTR